MSTYAPKNPGPELWQNVLVTALLGAAIIGILLGFSSCSPRVIEKIQVRTEYRDRIVRDTVSTKDSVYIREYIHGDTVRVVEYRERLRWRDRYIRDTVAVRDTIAVERIKEVEVAQPLTLGQRLKIRAFWALFGAVLLLLLWTFRKPLLKLLRI